MILKLTDTTEDFVLVNISSIAFMQKLHNNITRLEFQGTTDALDVKETIEEIEQQIKEGGITNGIN